MNMPNVRFPVSYDNDVACIVLENIEPIEGITNGNLTIDYHIKRIELASKEVLEAEVLPCDLVAFPGYPEWHDQSEGRPIMRTGTIASDPRYNYSWGKISGECIAYEAFSYGGSSGSPVFALQKGFPVGDGLTGGSYRKVYLIGVNAGHLNDTKSGFNLHSGISYMYKSTVILELIQQH